MSMYEVCRLPHYVLFVKNNYQVNVQSGIT